MTLGSPIPSYLVASGDPTVDEAAREMLSCYDVYGSRVGQEKPRTYNGLMQVRAAMAFWVPLLASVTGASEESVRSDIEAAVFSHGYDPHIPESVRASLTDERSRYLLDKRLAQMRQSGVAPDVVEVARVVGVQALSSGLSVEEVDQAVVNIWNTPVESLPDVVSVAAGLVPGIADSASRRVALFVAVAAIAAYFVRLSK